MGITKVLNTKSDLRPHSRSLAILTFDRPHTIAY